MNELIYPTLDLFVYQPGEELGAEQNDIEQNREEFLSNFPVEIRGKIATELAKGKQTGYAEFTELLSQPNHYPLPIKYIEKSPNSPEKYPIDGFYYPVQLSDTYGLLLDCSINNPLNSQVVSCFQALKSLTSGTKGKLGKSWILSGCLPNGAHAETLAQAIYREFMSESQEIAWEWQHRESGKFLGADIFSVWRSPDPRESLIGSRNIFIVLYPDTAVSKAILETAADLNRVWMSLFCFQNKILLAYEQAKHLKKKLETEFINILNTFREIKNISNKIGITRVDLENIQLILKNNFQAFATYVIQLSYLEIYQSTIEINLYNYELCLNYLEAQANKTGTTELNFLKKFSETVVEQYQKQVKKDYASLKPGLKALENLINYINGIVELEQSERDRRVEAQNIKFQNGVVVIGVGVGTASIAASSVASFAPQLREYEPAKSITAQLPLPGPALNVGITFGISLIVGVLFSLGTWGILIWRRAVWKRTGSLGNIKPPQNL